MKKTFKSILAVTLCFIMLIGTIAIGGNGFADLLEAISVKASADSYSVGDYIYYGTYPQTKVTDEATITALNNCSGTWVSYGYYSGSGSWSDGQMAASDYMRYKDVSYNGDKYRAVTFDSYRPYWTGYTSSTSNTYQDDNGYTTGNVYWFKYEPIKWRVLDPATGMVMCDTAIDSQAYNNYVLYSGSEYFGNADCTYYASNYAESSIREWLNNDFYNTAFSAEQKANILETTLDNSSTYSSTYDAPSTTDKVYLLSYADSINSSYGFNSSYSAYDTARQLKSTDYAKAQGCYSSTSSSYLGNCWWWLRSPFYSYDARSIFGGGYGYCYSYVYDTSDGAVPALNLQNLKSDYAGSEIGAGGTDGAGTYTLDNAGIKCSYSYSDSYFSSSATAYNSKLMQTSLMLAIAAMVDSGDPYENPEAAIKMFADCGYDDATGYYGYNVEPASEDDDSIACAIGAKNVDNTTIIAIGIRGGGYDGEWGSNFNVGKSGNHTGFDLAAKNVLNYLNQFLSNNSSILKNNIKIWVTGYSRAAATANLVAAKLDSGDLSKYSNVKNLGVSKNSVYAYTFETPQNTVDTNAHSETYNNIFNIVNPIDPVTKVAFTGWAFSRYGVDYSIPSKTSSGKNYASYLKSMQKTHSEIVKSQKLKEYSDDFVYEYVKADFKKYLTSSNVLVTIEEDYSYSQDVFEDNLMSFVSLGLASSRSNYSDNYQAFFTAFFKKYPVTSGNMPDMSILKDNLKKELSVTSLGKILILNALNMNTQASDVLRTAIANAVYNWASGSGVKYQDIYNLLGMVNAYSIANVILNINEIITTAYNGLELFEPHEPRVTAAWVLSCPEAITPNVEYSKAWFNCPVDIKVYDSEDNLVAAIIDDEPQYIEGSYVTAYVDENGQKIFCLPGNEEFRYEVTGNDEGTMTCSFGDYNFSTGNTENITTYCELPVDTATEYTVTSDKKASYDDALVVEMSENGEEIEPTEVIADASDNTYTITVETEADVGTAIGGGEFIKGEYCKLTAYEAIEDSFIGWYVNNELVSTDLEYRFMVDQDLTVVAKFKPHTHTYSETITAGPTCTEEGTETYVCTECKYEYTVSVPATGHKASEAVKENEKAATCTASGSYDSVVYCSVCGEELSREAVTVAAKGHDYKSVVTPATCTNGGYTTYTCSACGDSYTGSETSVLAHTDTNSDGICEVCGTTFDTSKNDLYKAKQATITVPNGTTVKYNYDVTMTAKASDLPNGYSIQWYDQNGNKVGTGATITTSLLTKDSTFTARIINSNGDVVSTSAQEKTVEIKVNDSFFTKIISFFMKLFGKNHVTI